MEDRPLAKDTREALNSLQHANPSLLWDKLLQPGAQSDEYKVVVPERGLPSVPVAEINAVGKRRRTYLEQLSRHGRYVASFDAPVESRLVVGFGAEHVAETNIRLERLRGFPIIPGSACKGLARTVATLQIAESLGIVAAAPDLWQPQRPGGPLPETPLRLLSDLLETPPPNTDQNPEQSPVADALRRLTESLELNPMTVSDWLQRDDVTQVRDVFGGRDACGQVTFLDALPQSPSLKLDIVNPHFGPYYGDKRATTTPSDTGKPIPTRFLVVPADVKFTFAITSQSEAALNAANVWLRRGLRDLGIGAKTAAGYGFFRISEGA